MLIYVYDGSIEGLFTAIYEAYYNKENPNGIIPCNSYQIDFLTRYVNIYTQPEKSDKVYESIIKKISVEAIQHVFYVFLSELDGVGTWIYEYLKLGYKVGHKLDSYLNEERVLIMHHASKKVSFECHRLLGLLRFQELKNEIFYAAIEPDHNVCALIAPHFADRYKNQNFIIHDVRRGIAAIYNKKEWYITDFEYKDFEYSNDEARYQKLWKEFCKSISIKERKNILLQKRCMPARYWKHLVEK